MNVQFKSTYSRHLYLSLHQDEKNGVLNLSEKLKLQLAYYLQLQDRIDEAIRVFKHVKLSNSAD